MALDGAGNALDNNSLGARYSIHDITIDGAMVWQELQAQMRFLNYNLSSAYK